jgi:hypothetical protein
VLWLYNLTGQPFLLDLARRLYKHTADWKSGVPDRHGVNFAQAFRGPATFYLVSHDPADLAATEKDYDSFRGEFGQVPGGMYGADENARTGFGDPRQGTETCAMVEMMLSHEYLMTVTGDPKWADRAEDVAFNSLPASMTADEKGLRYLTCANMPIADSANKSPGIQNSGAMLSMNPNDYRCCQHNVSMGWPYFVEHMWLGTNGNGLAAMLYGPCTVSAKVGHGESVTIAENTEYPFRDRIRMKLTLSQSGTFPLVLRVPWWCQDPRVYLNGKPAAAVRQGGFLILKREWKDGDDLGLRLPMAIRVHKWPAQKDAVSVSRGPLSFSLKIGEDYVRNGGTDAWPAYDIKPKTPWNFGLPPDPDFQIRERPMPADGQPFVADAAPVELVTDARRVPNWKLDYLGLPGLLQPSPARTESPLVPVELVPMGAARLRITVFPTVTPTGGHDWTEPPVPAKPIPAEASHRFASDTLDALSDNLLPQTSHDPTVPRFTWWDHKGTPEWVQYDFDAPRAVSSCEVYWYDDGPTGGCRVPQSWRAVYWKDGAWVPVAAHGDYGIATDKFNAVQFDPIQCQKLRLEVQLQPGFSAGILEWRAKVANVAAPSRR